MPYIENKVTRLNGKPRREEMDKIVDLMLKQGVKVNGDLNYILYKFAKSIIPSYNNYKNIIGELNCCAKEIYRRLVVPYEDSKIKENGDVK